MNETPTLILRDHSGAFYLLASDALAQARATAEEQAELSEAIAENDTTGYAAGIGMDFALIGLLTPIVSPRDLATGQASGKRSHGTIRMTQEWSA